MSNPLPHVSGAKYLQVDGLISKMRGNERCFGDPFRQLHDTLVHDRAAAIYGTRGRMVRGVVRRGDGA